MLRFFRVYETFKTVRIEDGKLGYTYWLMLLGIFFYIIIWQILFNRGYLEFDRISGALSARVHRHFGSGPLAFNTSTLPYCNEYTGNEEAPMIKQSRGECRIWDDVEVQYSVSDSSVLVTTSVTDRYEEKACEADAGYCEWIWKNVGKKRYFIADVETFELKIAHSFEASRFYEDSAYNSLYAGTSKSMSGRLVRGHGKHLEVLKSFPAGRNTDKILVRDLLHAAGVELDRLSDQNEIEEGTMRSNGIVMHIDLSYTNYHRTPFGTSVPSYQYRVFRIPETTNRFLETVPINSTHRITRKRAGINLQFVQTGQLGRFSVSVLMFHLISGLGLMAMATVIVDYIALYVLPNRHHFLHCKYDLFLEKMRGRHEKEEKGENQVPRDKAENKKEQMGGVRRRKPSKNGTVG